MYDMVLQEGEKNSNSMMFYCANCNIHDVPTDISDLCVSRTEMKTTAKAINAINEYSKSDPTLAHLTNIPCANKDCPTHTENVPWDVVYFKYDEINMNICNLCTVCEHTWLPTSNAH
jgi:hypothetical protein